MNTQTRKAVVIAIVGVILGFLSVFTVKFALADHPDRLALNLRDFNASGAGDQTMLGSVEEGSTELVLAPTASDARDTWQEGHGIRIQRAGPYTHVHSADIDWTLPPHAPSGAAASHDETDKMEGEASVRCTFTGTPPDADGDGTPDPVDLCEVDLGGPIDTQYDELRFWIKSSVATSHGDLEIVIYSNDYDAEGNRRPGKFQLQIPSLAPDTWTEVFAEIEARNGFGNPSGPQFVTLRCVTISLCDGLDIHLDDFWLVQDLVTQVQEINVAESDAITFTLETPAVRTVSDEVVYHDDTAAVQAWLQAAEAEGANLFAPAGTYYISEDLPLYSDTHLRCASADVTTFKNSGRSKTGTSKMLSTKQAEVPAPENIEIEHCGFDVNGWNRSDHMTIIQIQTFNLDSAEQRVQTIDIRNNRFFDSDFPGLTGCDADQDTCVTRQRLYISVRRVDGVWIEHNHLSGGGRIKAGNLGLGRNMYIRHNIIEFVNDNAITVTDIKSGETDKCIEPCLTEHVEITDNVIVNPITVGIFFGADGQNNDVPGMTLRDVTIARNRIEGFFGAGIHGILPAETSDVHITDNLVRSQPPTIKKGAAVSLKNGPGDTATDIRIERNTFIASGEFGGDGMLFQGPMNDLIIADNDIRCDGCRSIQRGFRFRVAGVEQLELRNNTVVEASTALQIVTDITNGRIQDNEFRDSTNEHSGQIILSLDEGEAVDASIARNRIEGGAGHGIYCQGDGAFDLVIIGNDFAGNAKMDIAGCPESPLPSVFLPVVRTGP